MLKYLLLPFSLLYGGGLWLRNKAFDRGLFSVYRSRLKTIVIGNLQAGGTGKTPMTAYLYELLSPVYPTAILSRGYGRKTRGLLEADANSTPASIGDEPYWYYKVLKSKVVLSEKRKAGLQYLEQSDTELVLLDDAFQHRSISGDIQLLLTDIANPYYQDWMLPSGRLREFRNGDKRADIIILTKCPDTLQLEDKIHTIKAINPLDHQDVFFTGLKPGSPYTLKGNADFFAGGFKQLIALSGIASPASFVALCRQLLPEADVQELSFRDHHAYSVNDLKQVLDMMDEKTAIVCTEKDAVKLSQPDLLQHLPDKHIFVLPVRPYFLFDEAQRFNGLVKSMLTKKRPRTYN